MTRERKSKVKYRLLSFFPFLKKCIVAMLLEGRGCGGMGRGRQGRGNKDICNTVNNKFKPFVFQKTKQNKPSLILRLTLVYHINEAIVLLLTKIKSPITNREMTTLIFQSSA